MYRQTKYIKEDPKYIFDYIRKHPFASFIIKGKELLGTHIPILTEGNADDFLLYGHIANNNEQWQHLKDDLEALLIFKGADSYVSSSWYSHENISTWDYEAVHINVKLKIQSKPELEDSLEKLVYHFEKDQENPKLYSDLPSAMVQEHLERIMGFWCHPYKVQAIAKLHQGFENKDVNSVIYHLKKSENQESQLISQAIAKEHGTNH